MSLHELVATLYKRVGQLKLELSICEYNSERVREQWMTILSIMDHVDRWFEEQDRDTDKRS